MATLATEKAAEMFTKMYETLGVEMRAEVGDDALAHMANVLITLVRREAERGQDVVISRPSRMRLG